MNTPPSIPVSPRFRRAAAAEQERLRRRIEKLEGERERLCQSLAAVEAEQFALSERLRTLEALSASPESEPQSLLPASARSRSAVLRGAAIREVAVRVLLDSGRVAGPLHYKEWLELVRRAGYAIEGKRPEAVFLNQLSRSPVVKATTRAGIYELDRGAPERLRHELQRLQAELGRTVPGPAVDSRALSEYSARREDLNLVIARTQRALEEALRVLGPPTPSEDLAA